MNRGRTSNQALAVLGRDRTTRTGRRGRTSRSVWSSRHDWLVSAALPDDPRPHKRGPLDEVEILYLERRTSSERAVLGRTASKFQKMGLGRMQ